MIEKLRNMWKCCETKQMAAIFEQYMGSIGAKKYDDRRKNNTNTYMIDAKSTNWNRVQCYYHKESHKYGDENLLIVLRKRAGDYLIIGKKSDRAFEIDYDGVKHYDESLLKEIMEEHRPLFDKLFSL